MNRLFVRTLLTILGALLILVALLAALSVIGLQRSIKEWDTTRRDELKAVASQILREHPASVSVPENVPLFVYDDAGKLVFSNRGEGTVSRARGEATPIRAGGRLLGFYWAGQQKFAGDAANSRFLASLRQTLIEGLVLSLTIAVAFALLFSRSLAGPAVRVARALNRIARGDLSTALEPAGAREIALIGASADRLRLQLLREQDLRRQWVHDVAHDLRTPVAALRAQFEAMKDGVLEVSPARLEKVLRELGRIQELVADLEELMRLESPEMHVSPESFDASALAEEVHERFELTLREKNIRFQSEIEPVRILGDAVLIRRAVSNFIANAVRHCPEGGSVTLAVEPRETAVSLSVANTGDPIPAQDLERVFDRLFRGERARHSAGSGLGLTIARRIAELHGGEVRIANRPDGVVVELLLPQTPQGSLGGR